MQQPSDAAIQVPNFCHVDTNMATITHNGVGQQGIKRHKKPISLSVTDIVRQ
jgi:hypothetical protein